MAVYEAGSYFAAPSVPTPDLPLGPVFTPYLPEGVPPAEPTSTHPFPPPDVFQRHRDLLETAGDYLSVALWSIMGTLTRYGLEKLFGSAMGVLAESRATGKSAALYADFYANIFGCFAMGLALGVKPVVTLPWLQNGFTTGFCGACTTFSAWMTSASYAMWAPSTDGHRVGAESFFQGVTCLVLGLATSWGGLAFGWRVGESLSEMYKARVAPHPTPPLLATNTSSFMLLLSVLPPSAHECPPVPPQPCATLPCPALPCPALPCPALPCPALPCPLEFVRGYQRMLEIMGGS